MKKMKKKFHNAFSGYYAVKRGEIALEILTVHR